VSPVVPQGCVWGETTHRKKENFMRTLKFRAWSKTEKKWVDDEIVAVLAIFNLDNAPHRLDEFVQFTGLFDKNGKEIWERDIVIIDSMSYGRYSAPVEYFAGRCSFGVRTWGEGARQISMPSRGWDQKHPPCCCDGAMYEALSILNTGDTYKERNDMVEVIGNIYENPELLKGGNYEPRTSENEPHEEAEER
jgi:hypothetical protein